jgi:hypothetical protein
MSLDADPTGIQVWTNPEAAKDRASLFGLSADAFYLAVVPKADLERAASELQQGREMVKRVIPLSALTELQGEEGSQDMTLTFHAAGGAAECDEIQLADSAGRDELLDALERRLGPDWVRERKPLGRFSAGRAPFVITLVAVGLTFVMYNEAGHIAAGEQLKAVGKKAKTRMFSGLMHWVEGEIGETGVLILGGVLSVLCAAWLLNAVLRPAIWISIKRTKVGP